MTKEERKHRQRENILGMYRRNYARRFWEAYRDGNGKEMQKWVNMGYAFRLGVCMMAPHSRYYQAFNRIDEELKKEICGGEE